jgi:hypothetical protein
MKAETIAKAVTTESRDQRWVLRAEKIKYKPLASNL